jgi:hypothetical protein
MNPAEIRAKSLEAAARHGLVIPAHLPLLERDLRLRHQDEVLDRLMCLNAAAAAAFGFDKAKALAWLHQEDLDAKMSSSERRFLQGGQGGRQAPAVESMWALAWALGFVPRLDFWKDCDDGFVALMPNLKVAQSSEEWRNKARLREISELMSACDLAYCLHWAVRQSALDETLASLNLSPFSVVERRHSLEWLVGIDAWDEIQLDT